MYYNYQQKAKKYISKNVVIKIMFTMMCISVVFLSSMAFIRYERIATAIGLTILIDILALVISFGVMNKKENVLSNSEYKPQLDAIARYLEEREKLAITQKREKTIAMKRAEMKKEVELYSHSTYQ